jgi:hypothetical protein
MGNPKESQTILYCLPMLLLMKFPIPSSLITLSLQYIDFLSNQPTETFSSPNQNPIALYKTLLHVSVLMPNTFSNESTNKILQNIHTYMMDFRVNFSPKLENLVMQTKICKTLQMMYPHLNIEIEQTIDTLKILFADIVIKEKKLIVEVDGPTHFLFN